MNFERLELLKEFILSFRLYQGRKNGKFLTDGYLQDILDLITSEQVRRANPGEVNKIKHLESEVKRLEDQYTTDTMYFHNKWMEAEEKLKQMQKPDSDEILWQEIFSLREKLKIAVEAIKSYDPKFDDALFTHRLNSVDYDQLMEELSGEAPKDPCECDIAMDAKTGNYIQTCPICGFTIEGIRRPARFCANCGQPLRGEKDDE